jgi:Tetracyclin repressor-like, C-terminal domain
MIGFSVSLYQLVVGGADAVERRKAWPPEGLGVAGCFLDELDARGESEFGVDVDATTLRFAAQDTPPQLTAAFAELRQAVGLVADEQDADALTEVLWAALHGLVTLSRAGRLRPGYDSERLQLLVNQFTSRRETIR